MSVVVAESRLGFDVLRLDSPGNRNALSLGLMAELADGVRRSAVGSSRGILLEHAGPAFCSGVDLRERRGLPATDSSHTEALAGLLELLWEFPRPVVALVDGAVRGGGMGLLVCADVVVASPRSSFAYSEVRVGVAPALVLAVTLAHTPSRRLLPHALAGSEFGAAEARELGVVTHIADEPVATGSLLLAELTKGAPEAQAVVKQLSRRAAVPMAELLAQTASLSSELFGRPEAAEGMAAFTERRAPAWVPA